MKFLATLAAIGTLSFFFPHPANAVTYATFNPSDKAASITLSNGNLTATAGAGGSWQAVRSTISKSSGKWYWEYHIDAVDANRDQEQGISNGTASLTAADFCNQSNVAVDYGFNGNKCVDASFSACGATFTTGDVLGFALDEDAGGNFDIYKNGTFQCHVTTTASRGAQFAAAAFNQGSQAVTANFGATPLTYTPPAGYCAGLADVCPVASTFNFWQFLDF